MDASAAVKLFAREQGSDQVRSLFAAHTRDEVHIAVPDLFVYELLRSVWRKERSQLGAVRAMFERAHITVVPPDDRLIGEAIAQSEALGCDLYDAFPMALASLLGAPLFSADAKAHARFPGVVLVGADATDDPTESATSE